MPVKHDNTGASAETRNKKSAVWGKIGLMLILLSGVFFFSMLAVPWLPISSGYKVILAGMLFVGVQGSWWVGAALAGPTAFSAMRSWLRRS